MFQKQRILNAITNNGGTLLDLQESFALYKTVDKYYCKDFILACNSVKQGWLTVGGGYWLVQDRIPRIMPGLNVEDIFLKEEDFVLVKV